MIAESPARHEVELGAPLVGKAGQMLDKGLIKAGIDRSRLRLVNLISVRPNHDKFDEHLDEDVKWGHEELEKELSRLRAAKVIVALGANPLKWLTGLHSYRVSRGANGFTRGGISDWRGSLISGSHWLIKKHPQYAPITSIPIYATYHPAAVLRQMEWHVDFFRDLKNAAKVARGEFTLPVERQIYFNNLGALEEMAYAKRTLENGNHAPLVDLVAIDTEQNPDLIGIATDEEVHVFDPNEDPRFVAAVKHVMENPHVCKVAHNWNHDAPWLFKRFGIRLVPPRFDTMGGAHILDPSLGKSLSPDISSRFTGWPFHKWMDEIDSVTYNAYDAACTYDAFWPIQDQLHARELSHVSSHDHKLLDAFMEMQERGFRIDMTRRQEVEEELTAKLDIAEAKLEEDVQTVVRARIKRFKKPHLFLKMRNCPCCGGGTKQRQRCWSCASSGGFAFLEKPTARQARAWGYKSLKELISNFPACQTCAGSGKTEEWQPFNSDSDDQVGDLIYRGLGIAARRYKGKETVRVKQLSLISDKHPLIDEIVKTQELRAQQETVVRLEPDTDGRLHCVFDPWGTVSGRVAGKEGLIYRGTNPMNIPKSARVFVVPDPGMFLMYPDMEQIEARAVCVLSDDPGLKAALTEIMPEKGKPDIHLFVQRALAKVGVLLTRQECKKLEYAAFYGIRASNLAKEIGINEHDATKALDAFSYVFPGVPRWHRDTLAEALDTRTLTSPTGRIRTWLGYIYDPVTKGVKYEVAKEMWSYRPQDMAAWVLGEGAIELAGEPYVKLLIHVHDALLMEGPVERKDELVSYATKALTRRLWDMDFPAEMRVGANWYEACA